MSSLEKEITRGFQLLSAYYTGKVGKSGYQQIHKSISEKEWKSDSFAEKADDMKALLFESDYFSILKSWLLRANKKGDEAYFTFFCHGINVNNDGSFKLHRNISLSLGRNGLTNTDDPNV